MAISHLASRNRKNATLNLTQCLLFVLGKKVYLKCFCINWTFAEVDSMTSEVGKTLIGLIDADGFITLPEPQINATIKTELNKKLSPEEIDNIFHSMQKWLDPPGIAARSLQESLLIQVNAFKKDDMEGWNDVAIVIETHLDDLIANRLPKVASSTGIGIERVKNAIEKMHELTLSPGRLIATETVLPVIPDAFIQYMTTSKMSMLLVLELETFRL